MKDIETIQFQADYLVPVYNSNVGIQFLTTYNNGVRWVNLWVVSVDVDNEKASISNAVASAEKEYSDAIANNKDESKLPKLQHGQQIMRNLMSEIKDTIYHKRPEKQLADMVSQDLARARFRANMDKAVYLEGVSYLRTKQR